MDQGWIVLATRQEVSKSVQAAVPPQQLPGLTFEHGLPQSMRS